MQLQLLPLEKADFEHYQDLIWNAFYDSLMGLMYPNGFTDAAKAYDVEQMRKDWKRHPDVDKDMKVINAATRNWMRRRRRERPRAFLQMPTRSC